MLSLLYDFGPHLCVNESFDAVTCHVALDLTSMSKKSFDATTCPTVLNSVSQSRGPRRCHVSHGFRLSLPTRKGFDATIHPASPKQEGSRRWLNQAFKARAFPSRTHTYSAAVTGKGHTCLASATVIVEAGKTCV
jgi:hypothetical protein